MNYGFVIDTRSCIGCHACSTACKSENEVPLGVNRTWVKSTEHGVWPDVRRSFQVTRCNHCANPPCVRICPTRAMYQRADGIVEFDTDACIGCKACLQACPYDAIHIDPDSHTAAKCHMCSHRVDIGLEPACVVVCPEHAILFGDLDDPTSEIRRVLGKSSATVRKPEQGTAPKLLYIQGNDVVLHPTVFAEQPTGLMFSDVVTAQGGTAHAHGQPELAHPNGTLIRRPTTQGLPPGGPIQVSGTRIAGHMAQVSYTVFHQVPWHWPVPAYLVTKGIAAGLWALVALGVVTGAYADDRWLLLGGGLLGLVMTIATTALLVYDLERPERFLMILTRGNPSSWLVRGAWLLIGFSTVTGLWWLGELFGLVSEPARMGLALATVPLAAGVAMYTGFLFAQAEGRDLWQSPLLPFHLLVQAAFAGAGALLLADLILPFDPAVSTVARWTFGSALAVDAFLLLGGELGVPHASEVAVRAAHEIREGKYRTTFWGGAVALGHLVPLLLLVPGWTFTGAVAAACALVGLYLYEYAFVMAPQEVPNS